MKKLFWFLFILGFLVLIWFIVNPSKVSLVSPNSPISLTTPTPIAVSARVIKVIDGDTIVVDTGQHIRYIGMNTPEVENNECYATEASEINKNLVLGKIVRLEKDVSETDKYGRLLRYVYIDSKMINDELVKDGVANVKSVPPDVKYKNEFLESEKFAKGNNLGLWASCKST